MSARTNYGQAIRDAHAYMLERDPKFFVLGQGVWAPWYVGNSMKDLDSEFGKARIIDTPVSEVACSGAALGAALCGYRTLVIHPRVDFMILAIDQIVTQAANWSHMFGGTIAPAVTFRGIVNRGGEQGAQHSQALHSWFAHIPGLRVVMPGTARDARDLLIGSILDPGPVVFIDDRWLYDEEDTLPPATDVDLTTVRASVLKEGKDVTIVSVSYGVKLAREAAAQLAEGNIDAEVIDLRMVNPIDHATVIESVKKTGRLCVVDAAWRTCGVAGEIIARTTESLPPGAFRASPVRVTLPDAPAPTSRPLEAEFYFNAETVTNKIREMIL